MKSFVKSKIFFVVLLFLCVAPTSVFAINYTLAYIGIAQPTTLMGDYTSTWIADAQAYSATKETSGEAYIILNFTVLSDVLVSLNYSLRAASQNDDDSVAKIWFYDWNANNWVYVDDGYKGYYDWTNGSLSGQQYSNGLQVSIMVNSTDSDGTPLAAVDYASLYAIQVLNWSLNNEADFIIYVGWPIEIQFSLSILPIFLGLIMIPASGLYLVRGGRDAMSMDKLFFVLVVFFVGWALLIGGIMP